MSNPDLNVAYTIDQVAEALHVAPTTVRRLIADGELPARKSGRRVLVMPSDLAIYLENLPKAGKP